MKMKHFLLIPIVLFLFTAIAYWRAVFDLDIITDEVLNSYKLNSNTATFLAILLAMIYIAMIFIDKKNAVQRLEPESDKKVDFKRETHNILSKLKNVAKDSEYERVHQTANITIEQINSMVKYVARFSNLYIGESVDVFDSVSQSLEAAKGQFIQNSKSIVNRIIIDDCKEEIEKRVANNQKIIEGAKILLNETVNYLDNKTSISGSPLENTISSLKTLNETIF